MKLVRSLGLLMCAIFVTEVFSRRMPTSFESQAAQTSDAGPPSLTWSAVPLEKMNWVASNDPGRDSAILAGDLTKPEMYIQIVRWKPNLTNMPHRHPDDRRGIVLSGTFYLGHGSEFDPNKLEVLPAGTYFTEPAGDAHFGVTKDEPVVLYFVGTGPSKSEYITQ